jgi:septal ring factor EnvC (AmiA/AmiB activator)
MTDDKELIARLRSMHWCVTTKANGVGVSDGAVAREAADRIEALTEQLAAASQDTKALEDELEMQEQEACMMENDYIKLEKERDALEAKLAQVVEVMRKTLDAIEWYNQPDEDGLYWGGANADLIAQEIVSARATLAEIKGESQ